MDDITREGLNKAGYKYYAFISYNNRDEKWAKDLQSKLRQYRLPSVARTEIGADVRIDPVFRYKTNLPVAHLREQIKEELERSKYLIVICSPNSAKPNIRGEHWVNDEVTRFIACGRTDRIVPVIVNGVPNSDDARECFCPALKSTQFSAVNLVDGSWLDRKHEFLRLVAKLLNLEPTQLIKEDEEEERRKRIKKFFCWLPLAVLALAGLLFLWDCFRGVTCYYSDYVDCFGLPEGVLPVAADDLGQRHETYRFDYRGYYWSGVHERSLPRGLFGVRRRLRKVVLIDSRGEPADETLLFRVGRSPNMEFEYDTDGGMNRVHKILVRGVRGLYHDCTAVQLKIHFSNRGQGRDMVVNGLSFMTRANEMRSVYMRSSGTQLKIGERDFAYGRATHALIERDGRGRMVSERSLIAPTMEPVCDATGVAGFRYELDEPLGRVKAIDFLDISGRNRMPDRYGVARKEFEYDASGNVIRMRYLNKGGRLVRGRGGFVEMRMLYDRYNNITNEFVHDASGHRAYRVIDEEDAKIEVPGLSWWSGCSYSYSNGFQTARVSLQPDGSVLRQDGEVAKLAWGCSDDRRRFTRSFWDADGSLMDGPDGWAREVMTLKAGTDLVHMRYFNARGDAAESRRGQFHLLDMVDDELGNRIWEAGYDADNRCKYAVRQRFDECGSLTNQVFYGANYAVEMVVDKTYDSYGNKLWERYYEDEERTNRLCVGAAISGEHNVYDDMGRQVAQWKITKDDRVCSMDDGQEAGWMKCYRDAVGQEIQFSNCMIRDGWRTVMTTSYSGPTRKRSVNGYCTKAELVDSAGRVIVESYLDENGSNVVSSLNGCAYVVTEWDDWRHVVGRFHYGIDRRPVKDTAEGVFGMINSYDEVTGKIRSRRYVGADRRSPCVHKNGYVEVRYEYDARGNRTSERCYGAGETSVVGK